MRRTHRITIDAFGFDLGSAPPLNRVIEAENQVARRSESRHQQAQQQATRCQRRPLRPIQHPMIILKVRVIAFARDAQASRDGTLANGKTCADQQRLCVFPNGLGKQRLKLYDEGQQFGR